MPNLNLIQTAFNGGEFSDDMEGRKDVKKRATACKTLYNCHIRPQGPVLRRSGTQYLADVIDHTVKSRLISFKFSLTDAYIIELGAGKCRFFRDKAHVLAEAKSPDSVDPLATPGTDEALISDKHYFSDGQGPLHSDLTQNNFTAGNDYFVFLPQQHDFATTDIEVATNLVTIAQHGYTTGQGPFRLRTTENFTEPSVDTNTDYYVRQDAVAPTDKFTLHASAADAHSGAAVVNFTGQGAGTHTIYPTDDYKRTKFQLKDSGGSVVGLTAGDEAIVFTPTPAAPYELELPYTESEIQTLQYVQSADVIYIAGGEDGLQKPGKISRYGNASWQFDEIDFIDGPWLGEGVGAVAETTITNSGTPSAQTGNDLSGNRKLLTASNDLFAATDIGRYVRLGFGGGPTNWGWAEIREYVSATVVRVNIRGDFSTAAATTEWRMGAWGGIQGYPSVVSFMEQRLAWAANKLAKNFFYASQTGVDFFEVMSPTDAEGDIIDSDSLTYGLYDDEVQDILWMMMLRSLMIGASDAMWPVQATTFMDPITPQSIQVKPTSAAGSGPVLPVVVDDIILYASRNRRKLLGLTYNVDRDSYVPDDFTIAASHICRGGLMSLVKQIEPHGVVWGIREDGNLFALTFNREQEVRGFGRHTLGGAFQGSNTVVESHAVIPETTAQAYDQIYFTAKRTINNAEVRYIEVMEGDFEDEDALEDSWFVDCGLRLTPSGSPAVNVTGLGHLEGQAVDVQADGAFLAGHTVQGGALDPVLPLAASTVVVGLHYDADVEPLEIDPPSQTGSTQNEEKRVVSCGVELLRTCALKVGRGVDSLKPVKFKQPTMGGPPTLFSGMKDIDFPGDQVRKAHIYIRQDKPYPMMLLGIVMELDVSQ